MLTIRAKPSREREGASIDGRVQLWWRFLLVATPNGRSENVQQETDFLNRTVTVSGTTYIESQEVAGDPVSARLGRARRRWSGADPGWDWRQIAHLVFHDGADPITPVTESRKMVEALKALGSEVKYAEYEGAGHNSWDNVAIRATLG